MSFRDLGVGELGDHCSRQQPKQRRNEEDASFERAIKANVRDIQECLRSADDQVDLARRGFPRRSRGGESAEVLLERAQGLAHHTEQLFRDWTVQLAGEPFERQRRKLSYEKLRAAMDEEATRLKDVRRRQEAVAADCRNSQSRAGGDLAAPSNDDDFESGLLDDSRPQQQYHQSLLEDEVSLRSRIAQERGESIRRIQGQVAEVHHIFRDLASIVTDQGIKFDTIDQHASSASVSTREAADELKKAVDRQKSARERLCWMLALVVVLFCLLVLPNLSSLQAAEPSLVPDGFVSDLAPITEDGSQRIAVVHEAVRLAR